MSRPVFRFAPSPNGRLHLGHAYSALLNATWAHRTGGRLLLRIEDIDPGRSRPDLTEAILSDLDWLGLRFDGVVRHQSAHLDTYRRQVEVLAARGFAYPCFCSRGDISASVQARAEATGDPVPRDPDGAPLYPGTCRALGRAEGAARVAAGQPHTWRLRMSAALAAHPGPHGVRVFDLDAGDERVEPARPARWGDPVIARRDVSTSYHLAVVMDDAAQGVTHVVRGADLRNATDLHILLQALIGLGAPRYHHHALLRDETGDKLAKSRGSRSLADLRRAGATASDIRRGLGFAER